jgi:2',3'-cyclic-nucleotide 2'-phosphodiesterase (5'-nucleotidase family)
LPQARQPSDLYEVPKFGNVTLLHITDTHAQLNPIYFREPNVNIGIGPAFGKAPHLVGEALLKHFGIEPGGIEAHAFSYLNLPEAAEKFGAVGGFAHLKTLVDRIRAERGDGNTLLMDGGDTWQGSGTAYWTRGMDMVGACNRLGVDVMTGHWEFTYLDEEVIKNIEAFKGDFVAQNVKVREEALFDYRFPDFGGFDEDAGLAFKPYTIKEVGGVAWPSSARPSPTPPSPTRSASSRTGPSASRIQRMQEIVDQVRDEESPDLVVVISHNGMDVDLKMASKVTGIDVIFGGHTHDGMPAPTIVDNASGKTLVTNAGSNGKFLGVMDLDVKDGKLRDYRYRLLPVFSNLLPADADMAKYIEEVRAPYQDKLTEELATTEELLYPPRQLQRHLRSGHLRRPAQGQRRADQPVARLPLGHHGAAGAEDHHGQRHGPDLHHLSGDLSPRDDRRRDQGHPGGRLRQPVQRRPLRAAGRRHGARRRSRLCLRPRRRHESSASPTCSSTTAPRSRPTRPMSSPAGPPSGSQVAGRAHLGDRRDLPARCQDREARKAQHAQAQGRRRQSGPASPTSVERNRVFDFCAK